MGHTDIVRTQFVLPALTQCTQSKLGSRIDRAILKAFDARTRTDIKDVSFFSFLEMAAQSAQNTRSIHIHLEHFSEIRSAQLIDRTEGPYACIVDQYIQTTIGIQDMFQGIGQLLI